MTNHDEAVGYLRRFGYLGSVTAEGTALAEEPSDEVRRLALADFQAMALIPVTGELDDATRGAMAKPRCGFPDRRAFVPDTLTSVEEAVAFGTRWSQAIVTYRFDNLSPDFDGNRQRQIIRTALDQWSAVVPLIFRESPAGQAADIRIRYAPGAHAANPTDPDPAFDGPFGVLAHGFFPPPNAGDLAGDVHYDEDEAWQDGLFGAGFDLTSVTVHEFGHSLGLDHTFVPNSTMNPFYPFPTPPQPDDRTGMRNVYREHIWIASLYRDLLGRRFDDAGLDFWVRQRFGAASPEGIARGFCYSNEFSESLARQLYFSLLDRGPDPGGLAFWTSLLRNGTSRQAVMTGFLQSAEYLSNNPIPNMFVTSLYQRLLGRAPDPGGFAFWVQQLNQGATPGDVARGFLFSEEFARNLSREQYQRFLRRAPDPSGWQFWTDRIRSGLAHQDLMVGFLASTEYQNLTESLW
jgi:hypothetical protein